MNKRTAAMIRAAVIALIVIFAALCTCFIPSFANYIISEISPYDAARIAVYLGGIILTLPCVVMLIMALRLPTAVAADRIFTHETASLLSRIAIILCIDCVLFFAAIIALFCIGEFLVSPLLALIDLIGFALAYFLCLLAGYIRRAAILKEEVDATL